MKLSWGEVDVCLSRRASRRRGPVATGPAGRSQRSFQTQTAGLHGRWHGEREGRVESAASRSMPSPHVPIWVRLGRATQSAQGQLFQSKRYLPVPPPRSHAGVILRTWAVLPLHSNGASCPSSGRRFLAPAGLPHVGARAVPVSRSAPLPLRAESHTATSLPHLIRTPHKGTCGLEASLGSPARTQYPARAYEYLQRTRAPTW